MTDAEIPADRFVSMVEAINAADPSTERRVVMAQLALRFFSVMRDEQIAEAR